MDNVVDGEVVATAYCCGKALGHDPNIYRMLVCRWNFKNGTFLNFSSEFRQNLGEPPTMASELTFFWMKLLSCRATSVILLARNLQEYKAHGKSIIIAIRVPLMMSDPMVVGSGAKRLLGD
jgi:hypothetical protein